MNRIIILTFVLLSLLFVTASSEEVLVKELNPLPFKLVKAGDDKLIAKVSWEGNLNDNEPLRTRFRCFTDAVTVKGPKHAVFGDREIHFELKIHKKNANVKCQYGVLDGVTFKKIISFRT